MKNIYYREPPQVNSSKSFENTNGKLYNTVKDPLFSLNIKPTLKNHFEITEKHEKSYIIKHKYLDNVFIIIKYAGNYLSV